MTENEKHQLQLGLRVLWWSLLLFTVLPFAFSMVYPLLDFEISYMVPANRILMAILGFVFLAGVFLVTRPFLAKSNLSRAFLVVSAVSFLIGLLQKFILSPDSLLEMRQVLGYLGIVLGPLFFMNLSKNYVLKKFWQLWLVLLVLKMIEGVFAGLQEYMKWGIHSPGGPSEMLNPISIIALVLSLFILTYHLVILHKFRKKVATVL